MRKLLVGVTLGLSMFSALAHAIPDWLIPSPITIAIQIGKWIMSQDNQEEVYYIRVQSQGVTENEARKEAFRFAIDQAIGSLLISETEIQNDLIKRHNIIDYSSGYIYDFEYVNKATYNGKVYLEIDVWVVKSNLAERLIGKSSQDDNIAGEKLDDTLDSIQQERKSGDQIINVVLGDFPYKSFDIKLDGAKTFVTDQRTAILRIDYEISWNKYYLQALEEAVTSTSTQSRQSIAYHSIGFEYWRKQPRHYVDAPRYNLYYRHLHEQPWAIMIQLWNTYNQEIYQICSGGFFSNRDNLALRISSKALTLYPSYRGKYYTEINLTNIKLKTLDRYTIKAVRYKDCQ